MNISKLNKSMLLLVALAFVGSQAQAGWFQSGKNMLNGAYGSVANVVSKNRKAAGIASAATSAWNATLKFVKNHRKASIGVGAVLGTVVAFVGAKKIYNSVKAKRNQQIETEESEYSEDSEYEEPAGNNTSEGNNDSQEELVASIHKVIDDIKVEDNGNGQQVVSNIIETIFDDIADLAVQVGKDSYIDQICTDMYRDLTEYLRDSTSQYLIDGNTHTITGANLIESREKLIEILQQ